MSPSLKSISLLMALLTLLASTSATGPAHIEASPLDFPICLASCVQQVMQCANQCALQGPTIGGLLCVAFCSNQNLMCAGSCTGEHVQYPVPPVHPPVFAPIHA